MIVIDSSYALALVMPDESRPVSAIALLDERLVVPVIWPLEVAHVLRNAIRANRMQATDAAKIGAELSQWGIDVLPLGPQEPLGHLESCQRHGLTPYDALYVELAAQCGALLATLDAAMARAASHAGVTVLK